MMSINRAPSNAVIGDLSSPHASKLSAYSSSAILENPRTNALFTAAGSMLQHLFVNQIAFQ